MTHVFNIPLEKFDLLAKQCRSLFVKDNAKIASGDEAVIQAEDSEHREQLKFTIISVEHGPGSKYVMSPYCLLGLYAPYGTEDDIKGVI